MKRSHHQVMFCCNDDHGMPSGHVEQIEIADEIRIVAGPRPPVHRFYPKQVQVSRDRYEHLGTTEWVGNIFWTSATMHVGEARRLIRNLLAKGWRVEEWAEAGPFAHLVKTAKPYEPGIGTAK